MDMEIHVKKPGLPFALSCAIGVAMLSGCAASVKSGGGASMVIQESAKQNLVVSFSGNEKVLHNDDWPLLKRDWSEALQAEAASAGYSLKEAQNLKSVNAPGVGITVNVSNFRYLTPGARYGAGVMVGNAWVNSTADFSDLNSGSLIGSRTYDTSSSAWEGVMSAMTQKQVQAIAKQIIADIKSAKGK
jgi:hypothetical protein